MFARHSAGQEQKCVSAVCTAAALLLAGPTTAFAADFVPPGSGPARMFDIREFGARPDGKTLCTEAIQTALNQCDQAGGGVVRIPAGTWLSKPISLANNTTLQLDARAVLQAVDDPQSYAEPQNTNSLVSFISGKNLLHISIQGPGRIDGSGLRWWMGAEMASRKGSSNVAPRPRLLTLNNCRHVDIRDLTLQNSPSFHLVPIECTDLTVSNVTIKSPSDSPNTDGIVLSRCKSVVVTHCLLDLGGDNIGIKSGQVVAGRTFASEDILVTNCTFLRGDGMAIGSETSGGVRNVTVADCNFQGTRLGISIKSQRGRGGQVENIRYRDIQMKNVDAAFFMTCSFQTNQDKETAAPASRVPAFRDIQFANLSAASRLSAGCLVGLPESPISEVTLENVRITSEGTGLAVTNARAIHLQDVQITAAQGLPLVIQNAQVDGDDWARQAKPK
jgi:polygalacturonase